ncbi:alpha/beta fold hydrolase [Methanosarcina sp. T3]|uniref:alpha/beta fold hydrolase n=1 Tax=Methanosarcina sp. T3 TaxID=3439062 RepID=UPI003F829EBD
MRASTIASSAYFTTSDGVRLHYLDKGNGPPLVLLPAWTQPASGFAAQLEVLSTKYRCLALDFRGYGGSERPAHGYRVSRFARDCFDFFNHLGLHDVVLLGHSAGCTVIWSFIDLFGQDRIRALVLCDEMIAGIKRPEWSEAECRMYGASSGGDEALALAATIAGRDGEQMLRNFLVSMFTPEFPKADIARVVEGSLEMPRGAAAELLLSVMQADFRDVLPLIKRPTLCIGGKESHLGPEVMPWIASQIPGAKVVMFDTPHFVYLEKPVEFNATVCAFLKEVDAASR